MFKKLFGDRAFYKMVLAVVLPIMIQNGITNFVGLLDNIMVGQIGTEQMSGVSIVNTLINVFNLTVFGAISGPGIFGAQYYGSGNTEYLRYTFRFKFMICTVIGFAAIAIFHFFDTQLISLYLHDTGNGDINATLSYAESYIAVIIIGLLPFAYTQMYASTLRETGQTFVPMVSGFIAVLVNLVLNYILIFGHFGAPAMGVIGAAVATVISRYVEMLILVLWTHLHPDKNTFIVGAYRSMRIPGSLLKRMARTGTPLLFNEFLFSLGMSLIVQCYSVRGLDAVAAVNINTTIQNVFNIAYMALGSAISIIVGQQLGAGKLQEARDTDTKLIAFAVVISVCVGALLVAVAPLFPRLYNTTDSVKQIATNLIRVTGCCMPLFAFTNSAYFTMRSGGRTVVTFLFDSFYIWVVSLPLAFILVHFTALPIIPVYAITQGQDFIKCVIGFILLRKGIWVNNIATVDQKEQKAIE